MMIRAYMDTWSLEVTSSGHIHWSPVGELIFYNILKLVQLLIILCCLKNSKIFLDAVLYFSKAREVFQMTDLLQMSEGKSFQISFAVEGFFLVFATCLTHHY
ncbi:hypothetical protein HS088_TW07G00298 [Tripterygium wilfordii]|uniref:Uncharacterized protein n=1 Tax=Tripterygium wilfordii TaxID=458696 RepID=A0A7J7DEN0_TRIWF|nr:hypothetical protein HS088_TW07G00298 [Tripterygium wilfordii]